ncbi:MAG: acyl-CoA thioesterase II [Gammaproteobacteria bacterium]|nr:acyl-CoA thioesterase II [Gammaproteobacteria bacterium]
MNPILADLIEHLSLERLERNLFRGDSRDIGTRQVFGGQVLGQALAAASQTVEKRLPHSLHAYFLRRGDLQAPIIYEVDRARDGGSFTARRVVAIQHGRQIFNMACSFQREEAGLDHQDNMPQVPPPEELRDVMEYGRELKEKIPELKLPRFLLEERPFEFRPVQDPQYADPVARPPRRQVWLRAVDRLPDDELLQRSMLAYVSDYGLIGTATLPHGVSPLSPEVQMASLDHAMWFHRPFRLDDWLLYDADSPSASGSRGFARGRLFTRDGGLAASVAQEGLMRIWDRGR